MNRALTPKQVAAFLLIPAALILFAALPLVPWLVETKARLDNSYWETQLVFAAVSLCMAALSAPCLLLRLCCSGQRVALACWCAVLAGYLTVFVYAVQSHFPLPHKLVLAGGGAALSAVAGYGLKLDWKPMKHCL